MSLQYPAPGLYRPCSRSSRRGTRDWVSQVLQLSLLTWHGRGEKGDWSPTDTAEGKGAFTTISKKMDNQLDFPPDTSVSTPELMGRGEVVQKAPSLSWYEPWFWILMTSQHSFAPAGCPGHCGLAGSASWPCFNVLLLSANLLTAFPRLLRS